MYTVLVRAGFTLVGLGFLLYTAWRTGRALTNLSSESGGQNSQTHNFAENSITKCLVCLEEFTAQPLQEKLTLPCKHKFHKECISKVFSCEGYGRTVCPLCRASVSKDFIKNSGININLSKA